MRIRSVFLLSVALGSAVGVVAALPFALQQWSAFEAARAARRDTLLLGSALRLPETMNMERAFINARLVASTMATPMQSGPMLRQIELVDTALSNTRDLTLIRADAVALRTLQDQLLAVRRRALAALARPPQERSAPMVEAYLQDMFAVQSAAYALASAVHERINATNPNVGQATRLALLAWDLRDWSGRQTTTLISYIGLHLPMEGEQAETLALYRGRIEQKWLAASAFAARVDSPDVTAALKDVERGFWAQGGEAYETQVVPNRGRILDIDTDSFVNFIRPILDTILPLRDSALNAALQLCDADIAERRTRFILALALLLLTALAAIIATRWFDRRVLRPVEQITAIILALASGNRGITVPHQHRTDELGQMANAIEALRCNAIQAEALGREMLASQKARADEKSHLLAELTRTNEDLAALNLELEALATTDALTGVPNRRSFDLLLAREWRRAQREEASLGLLLLDVDNFKSFNDFYGHPAGDVCLASVASSMSNAIRRPGDIIARYGGEEFAVILPNADLPGAIQVAEAIRLAVAARAIPHAQSARGVVTVSIGVAAIVPQTSEAPRVLVSSADAALYAAKHAGRDQVTTIQLTAATRHSGVGAEPVHDL